jgi:Flp pilus assembly protein TadD
MTAKLYTLSTRRERNRTHVKIGPNQLSLLRALLAAPNHRFPSLRAWYRSPHATGGAHESRRQSCWGVIGRGWASAKRGKGGGWHCSLTKAGRDIAEGRTPYGIRWRSKYHHNSPRLLKGTPGIRDDFDGFITAKGELVSIEDTRRMFSIFTHHTENSDQVAMNLRRAAEDCLNNGYYGAAFNCLEKALCILEDPGEKAECLLRMGQVMEEAQSYEPALKAYLRAFDLPQGSNDVWYFLNNNAGYCLNRLGDHRKAERYCRAAIEINPARHNAHKNLGIALQNQGKHVEAARSYIKATKMNPLDSRALDHLKQLLSFCKDIFVELPDLMNSLVECQRAVSAANGEDMKVQ